MNAAPKDGPAWSLDVDVFNRVVWLSLLCANGHTVKFSLPSDSPLVLGIRSTEKLTNLEPA